MEISPAWYALHVKPRHEFQVHGELVKSGLEAFLPTTTCLSQWRDRKKLVDFPLFPGYLFSRVLPVSEFFLQLVKTRGVIRILSSVPGRPDSIPEAEISALQAVLAGDHEVAVHPGLQPGRPVRIKRGVFENVTGVVARRGGQFLLHVNITMLGRSVTVKLFADDLEPL